MPDGDCPTASHAGSNGTGQVAEGRPGDDGSYRVRLDVFEGPFDLLLQLISERKLDVSEVDLADITGDFLAHLRLDDPEHPAGLGALDLDTATHFLVVAATLIELKAARLLPTDDDGDLEDLLAEARDVLYARLLEYRAYRDVAERFASLWEAHAGFFGREVALEPRFQGLAPDVDLDIDASTLAGIAAVALAPQPEAHVDTGHITGELLSVRDAAERVLARLPRAGAVRSYRRLVAGLGRAERVVHFLALLELFKLGHVELDQPDLRGDLRIRRLEGGAALDGLDEGSRPPSARAGSETGTADGDAHGSDGGRTRDAETVAR